jgi:hypothetical protein
VIGLAASARAADTVIGFDDLSPDTFVTSQYHAQGADFNLAISDSPKVRAVGAGVAHSGDRVLDFSGCAAEICSPFPTLVGRFPAGSPRTHLKIFVGDFASTLETKEVRLSVFDASEGLLQQTGTVSVSAGAGFGTALEITRPSADIASFQVEGPGSVAHLAVDDVSFDPLSEPPPPLPALPTVAIASPTAGQRFATTPALLHVTGTVSAPGGVAAFCVAGPGHRPGIPSLCNQIAAVHPDGSFDATLSGLTTGPNFISAWVRDKAGQIAHQEVIVQVASGARLSVNGIDVTQGIQTEDLAARDQFDSAAAASYEGVLLAAGHRTIVRVYANAIPEPGHPNVPNVAALLYGCHGKTPVKGAPLSPEGGMRTLPFGFPLVSFSAERTNPDGAYTFTLPPEWTRAGSLRLKAQVFEAGGGFLGPMPPPAASCASSGGTDSATMELDRIPFVPTNGFSIHPVLLDVKGATIPDPLTVFDRIRAITPTAEGEARLPLIQGFTEYIPGDPPHWKYLGHEAEYEGYVDITDLQADLMAGKTSAKDTNTAVLDRLVHYVNHGGCGYGCGSVVVGVSPGTAYGLTRQACGDILHEVFEKDCPNDAPTAVTSFKRPLTSVAHELYHGLGRVHASPSCGGGDGDQRSEPWPPDELGYIQGIGIDPRPGSGGAAGPYRIIADPPPEPPGFVAKPGSQAGHWYDFMSYCASPGGKGADEVTTDFNSWISVKGWEEMLRALRTDCSLVGGLGDPHRTCPGDLDFAARRGRVSKRKAPGIRGLRVTGSDDGTVAQVLGVESIKATPPQPVPGARYRLVARNAAGGVLSDTAMATDESHVLEHGAVTLLTGQTPAIKAASVEIVRDGTVIASRTRSRHAPSVRFLAPRPGQTVGVHGKVKVRWRASDVDGGALVANLDYSRDGGHSWKPIFAGPDNGHVTLPSGLLSHSAKARLRLRVGDGFNETTVVSRRFTAIGGPPAVRIASPAPNQRIAADATLDALGEAWDDRQAPLRGRSLHWFDGRRPLGTGMRLSVTGLRPGRRVLRLVGRDASGRVTSDSVRIRVLPVRPLFVVLTAPKTLSRSARRLRIRVAASVPSTLLAGGRKFSVDRHPRKLRLPVKRGATTLVLRLQAGHLKSAAKLAFSRGAGG